MDKVFADMMQQKRALSQRAVWLEKKKRGYGYGCKGGLSGGSNGERNCKPYGLGTRGRQIGLQLHQELYCIVFAARAEP